MSSSSSSSSSAPPLAKKIRLEQKALPVSSEEELNLITLREQNQKLSNNYNHRIRIEADLKKRIEQLEETLRSCEDKEPEHQLTLVNEDLRNRVEDLEFELNKVRLNERRLADDLERINNEFIGLRKKSLQTNHTDSIRNSTAVVNYNNDQHNHQQNNSSTLNSAGSTSNIANFDDTSSENKIKPNITTHINDNLVLNQAKAIQDLEIKFKDQAELARSRLNELESLHEQHKDALLTIDKLKIEAKSIPKEVIIETNEYKTLQSHFSVLYNEATQLKTQLLESRAHIIEMKNAHIRQIDRMEHDELRIQRELRTNIVDLEQSLAETRGEYNVLRLELDNMSKQYEATIKLDTELKKTLSNYRIQVTQRTNEVNRLKRLLEESKRAERHHIESNKNSNHTTNNGDNLSDSLTNHSTNTPTKTLNSNNNHNNNTSSTSTNNSATTNNITSAVSANNNANNHPKKILDMEKIIHQLQKQLDKMKSEEEALMNDLDVTGQAYEDSQEQNHRLLEQLEEKDNANFKLMSEHLKTNAFHKHLNEEKALLEEHRDTLMKRLSAQENVIKGLEEKIHLLQENMSTLEKELETRNSMNDRFKRELLDSEQKLAELNSEKQKILNQLDLTQKSFSDRSSTLTHESFKNKRLIEELESLKKKYERASKLQSATTPDEVLMEEIREYKEQLTCPSCKTKPKDAVLTKCFHVFCFDCLKTRVDTRQRKCPKCNAQFGANDFHRLYLA